MNNVSVETIVVPIESLEQYYQRDQGRVIRTLVNLAAYSGEPDAHFPWMLSIVILIENPNSLGFPTDEEHKRLELLVDALDQLLSESRINIISGILRKLFQSRRSESVKFVGMRVGGGYCQLYYYHHEKDEVIPAVQEWLRGQPQRNIKIMTGHDPAWENYIQFLHPGPELLRQILLNRAQLQIRQTSGDDLTVARPVDHTVKFPSASARKQFLDAISASGDSVSTAEADSPGAMRYLATITRSHRIDEINVELLSIELSKLAKKFNGEYDGWGAIEIRANPG